MRSASSRGVVTRCRVMRKKRFTRCARQPERYTGGVRRLEPDSRDLDFADQGVERAGHPIVDPNRSDRMVQLQPVHRHALGGLMSWPAAPTAQTPESLGKLPMAGRALAPKGSFLARLRTRRSRP